MLAYGIGPEARLPQLHILQDLIIVLVAVSLVGDPQQIAAARELLESGPRD
jgi:hypothetical protein